MSTCGCSYTIADSERTCQRPVYDDCDRCVFHLTPARRHEAGVSSPTLGEAFLADIDADDPARREYVGDPDQTDTVDGLKHTYLEAKQGASESGDSETASMFFVRELRYRRRRYAAHARRALLWSLAVIAGTALLIPATEGIATNDEVLRYARHGPVQGETNRRDRATRFGRKFETFAVHHRVRWLPRTTNVLGNYFRHTARTD